jgi:transposase-like protein
MARQPADLPSAPTPAASLDRFACPNPDCASFNRFATGNLHVAEEIGKRRVIRRLYCTSCGQRFSEHQGTLLQDTKLPLVAVVRIVKCLTHGCSIEAAADICEVAPRTIERFLEAAGRRAEDFQRLQLDRLGQSPPAVQLDELHARVATEEKKGGPSRPLGGHRGGRTAARVAPGSMSPWR